MLFEKPDKLEAPALFYSEKEVGAVVLGQDLFRDDRRPVVLVLEDRRRHLYGVGKTGMGKTTLIQNMIIAATFSVPNIFSDDA